jgi:phosphinothricin acetyltransferase
MTKWPDVLVADQAAIAQERRNTGTQDEFCPFVEKTMRFVQCSFDSHAQQILDILNDAIVTSTALYDYQTRSPESMDVWFRGKSAGHFPVIGALDDDDRLLGFATYSVFRTWPAYKYSVEHSLYIHKHHRGKGIGLALMQQLIDAARSQQFHVLVGGIDRENRASIALHESLGFAHAGTIRQAGFKFGRWLDLAFYQLVLDTPAAPLDG